MDKQEEKQPDDNVIDDITNAITTIILNVDITTSVKCKNKKIGRSRLCDKNCDICFNNSFASHEKSQYWSNENVDEKGEFISPRIFPKASTIKCKFNCDKCHHVFESVLSGISQGKWCPYCFNKLCNIKDCIICFNKSFASNEKSQYWSIENVDLNGEFISPRDVTKHTTKRYKFNCDKCHHVFESILNCISSGTWCPHCAINKLCNLNDCSICFNKSFASHEKSQYWSIENVDEQGNFILTRNISKYTNKSYKFDCPKCHHTFESILSSISKGVWCPFCGSNNLCNATDCDICFDKSFASNEKSKYWSIENVDKENKFISPRDVTKSTSKIFKFNCIECSHMFESCLHNISNGKWCPFCKNKTELILQNFLKNNYENIETQYKTTWCINTVNNRNYRYDFVLHNHNIIIELDGRQHFIQVSNWNSPYKQFLTDKYKEYCANNNEYSIIRILQNDVYFNKNNWIEKLNNSISKIIEDGVIQNIYMCENNEYHQYLNFNWKHIINSIKIIKRFYLKYIK